MSANFIFVATAPHVPFVLLYVMWVSSCTLMSICAKTRGSFGMVMIYSWIAGMDFIGLLRITLL